MSGGLSRRLVERGIIKEEEQEIYQFGIRNGMIILLNVLTAFLIGLVTEKRLEIQRNETVSALQILMGYAEKLVARNLEKNRDSIEQIKKFSMNIAQFFCVEGHEHGCDERIMEKYIQPYERMLEGDKNALSGVLHNSISKDNMEVFLTVIGRYKLEMLNDYNPVYDEDLKFCESIMKDIVHQYIYESEIYQRMMEGREVAQMQDNDENEVEEEQNGLTMRIRGD